MKCLICNGPVDGGYPPDPVYPIHSGRACDWCYDNVVMPVRRHIVYKMATAGRS